MERNQEASFDNVRLEDTGAPLSLLWNALRCSDLPSGVDYYMLDIAAEHGAPLAAQWLNLILGICDTDICDMTVSAARRMPVHVIIASLELHRRRRARASHRWSMNHSVFTNRYNRARRRAVSLFDEVVAA